MTSEWTLVKKTAIKEKSRLVRFLKDIVRIKSLSGNEGRVSDRVKREMKDAGFDRVTVSKSGSVIGRIGSGKKRILYDAHIDTVGIGDVKKWTGNPYGAVLRKGVLYGRGSCDDKGSVAAMVFAGKLIKLLGLESDYSLFVSASVLEEEAEGRGISEVLKITGRPECVIIGEPSGLRVIRGHKGRIGVKITTRGKSVHASIPEKGINAIYRMNPLVKKVENMNKSFQLNSVLGRSTISVTGIESGGASLNTVPDSCVIYLDRRTTEKETKQKVMREMKALAGRGGRVEVLNRFFPAWLMDKEHAMLKSAVKTYKCVFENKPEVHLWPFCTNGSYTMGEKKIPTLGFGPGNEKHCHVPNESIKVEEVMKAVMFYALFPKMFVNTAGD